MRGFKSGGNQQATNRKTIAHAFGGGNQVGTNAGAFKGEEGTGATVARLNFVENEYCFCLLTGGLQALQKADLWFKNTGNALYAFNNNGTHIAFSQLRFNSRQIVQRQEADLHTLIHSSLNLRIVGHGHRSRGAPMKGFFESQYATFPGMKGGQLYGDIIGFCARITQKQPIVFQSAYLPKFPRQLLLQRVLYRVGIESDAFYLLRKSSDVMGVTVAYTDHGVAAIQIEVTGSLVVPHITAFGFYGSHGHQGINIK